MRGQRLLIRPVTPDDAGPVASFLAAEGCPPSTPGTEALIGKVVGELAAHLAFAISREELHILSIVVSTPLRRKRIGRTLVSELSRLARKMRCSSLVAARGASTDAFFQRIGFELHEDVLVKRVDEGEEGR